MIASPLAILMANAVLFGFLAAILITIAISVNAWQSYKYDPVKLNEINNTSQEFSIFRLSATKSYFKATEKNKVNLNTSKSNYLFPSYSGLWRLCDDLTDEERELIPVDDRISKHGKCFTFVTEYNEELGEFSKPAMQISRLHNSAASCYIVVIIDLVTAAVVGIIGLTQKQVASCMVTGVLYCMAALFGIFGLAMFHAKNYYEHYECYSFKPIPPSLCTAREDTMLWAIPVAWIGVIFCTVASALWLIVARALRVIMAKAML